MSDRNSNWLLMRATEDGLRLRWLSQAELAELLADPAEDGIEEFCDPRELSDDHNYWGREVGVLLRAEVVIPEPAGAYRLPGWALA